MKTLLLENIHPKAVSALEGGEIRVMSERKSLGEQDLISKLEGVSILGIRSRTQISSRALESAPSCYWCVLHWDEPD
jgi:D-3-phosphoglycerate dehydrogenase